MDRSVARLGERRDGSRETGSWMNVLEKPLGLELATRGSLPHVAACVPDHLPTIHASLRARPGTGRFDGVTPAHESAPSGLLAGRVHPRWLSWGSSQTQDWGGARAGPGPSAPRTVVRAARAAVVAACSPVREIDAHRRPAHTPFQSLAPRTDRCRSPGPCPLVVGGTALQRRRTPPLQGLAPRPELRPTWRAGRLLS
jgi:hypothetical protein